MTICNACGQEMQLSVGCTLRRYEVQAGEITVAESVEAHDRNDMDLVELCHEAGRYRSRHKQAAAEADRLLRIAERHERIFRRMLRVNAQSKAPT